MLAEYTKLDQKKDAILLKPENLSFPQAAGVGAVALTA
jgi:NADPH:quinone reductase-like Zn-dependent oxidoreductase